MVGHRRQEANKTKPRPTSPLGASRSARIRHSRGPSRRLSPEASCSRRCVRLPTFMYFSDAPLLACASGLSRRLCRLGIFRAGLARQPGSPGSIIAGTGRPDLSWATGSPEAACRDEAALALHALPLPAIEVVRARIVEGYALNTPEFRAENPAPPHSPLPRPRPRLAATWHQAARRCVTRGSRW